MKRAKHSRAPNWGAVLVLVVVAGACDRGASSAQPDAQPSASVSSAPPAPTASTSARAPSPDAGATRAPATPPAKTEGCEDGMVRVEGDYCPVVIQDCAKHHPEYAARKDDPNVSERCLEFKQPTRCFVKDKKRLAFCMDRYEYPNQVGELPRILVSWHQAKARCEKIGKRLCTEDEFNFACEGPEMLPHVYGFVRDPNKCNIDKAYEQPDHSRRMLTYDNCLKTDWCAAELTRLDKRHRIGATHVCVSWAGVVDLNGNVNEWVNLPGSKPPNRSGLKGGWWGPVRNRCRPTVKFHKEGDYGYEAGFRCCKDVADAPDAGK
jgi:hypothetical protein